MSGEYQDTAFNVEIMHAIVTTMPLFLAHSIENLLILGKSIKTIMISVKKEGLSKPVQLTKQPYGAQ